MPSGWPRQWLTAPTVGAAPDPARRSGSSVPTRVPTAPRRLTGAVPASSDNLYVREREWEAAHTVWLWSDMSRSMNFKSSLSRVTKRERAVVLMLAAAELLVRGGERVGLMGFTRPTGSRKAATKLAEMLVANAETPLMTKSRPPKVQLNRHSDALLFGDFLAPIEAIRERVEMLAGGGASGHIVQVLDPAEESLPYEGRTEFRSSSGRERFVADRAESLRDAYQKRMRDHRMEIADIAKRLGWSFMVHHTDRPASEPLLSLVMRMAGTAGGTYRWQGNADASKSGGAP